jgi:hypothetical protein
MARAERIRLLRAAGRVADGERYGWLTVAGLHAGLSATESLGADPSSVLIETRASDHDALPCPLLGPVPAAAVTVPGTPLGTFDARDPAAAALARAVCAAAQSAIVGFCGAEYAAGPFLDAVADRIRATSESSDA